MKKPAATDPLRNIQDFVDGTRGQITIGEIPPIRSAALAAVGKKVHVAPLRRDQEPISEFPSRLDTALGQAVSTDTVIDEVLPEIQRRRSR